jgi:hypothetical protein
MKWESVGIFLGILAISVILLATALTEQADANYIEQLLANKKLVGLCIIGSSVFTYALKIGNYLD